MAWYRISRTKRKFKLQLKLDLHTCGKFQLINSLQLKGYSSEKIEPNLFDIVRVVSNPHLRIEI